MSQLSAPALPKSPPALHSSLIPTYVLRGHVSSIHALHFFAHNAYLISGDSDGYLVVWNLTSKRPAAVWKAHDGGITGVRSWGRARVVTHGRDHRLKVWQLKASDLEGPTVADGERLLLPADRAVEGEAEGLWQPWLLHSLPVHALNFAKFAMCYESKEGNGVQPVIVAVPNGLDNGGIDVFKLPFERRVSQIPSNTTVKAGMVMALSMFHQPGTGVQTIVSGYEDGRVMVHVRRGTFDLDEAWIWDLLLLCKPHAQPVLSVDISPVLGYLYTSSADAVVSKIAVPNAKPSHVVESRPEKVVDTKHAGQQDLTLRSDGKIFATAGWDGRVRVYSAKTLRELAVLKWHDKGCGAVAFADIDPALDSQEVVVDAGEDRGVVMRQRPALDVMKEARSVKAQSTHWLAAGGKDGKISLWEVY